MLVIVDSEARTPAGDPMLRPWTDASGNADSNIDHSLTYDKNGVLCIAFQANDPQFSPVPRADRAK